MPDPFLDYPFAALVGQEQMRTALLLNAVNPAIGGVLIRGEKGTAKSTAARSLAALMPPLRTWAGCPFRCDPVAPWPECPHCSTANEKTIVETSVPFVDLPLGATEDRVLGSLDFEKALREGRRAFQPGLLAAAHRGVLYIDEVNLLADHLVDVLLDAAALGVNTVEREGMAVMHPARFILIGTMNPEEGDLRPQLLDRFGLMVVVAGPREPEARIQIVRRCMEFEADSATFIQRWSAEQDSLRARIVTARACLSRVALDDEMLDLISRLCCELEVDGLRADLVLHRAARTLAALDGRLAVCAADVRVAAPFVLAHRRRRRPFEQPGLDRDRLENFFARAQEPDKGEPGAADSESTSAQARQPEEGNGDHDSRTDPALQTRAGEHNFEPAPPRGTRPIVVTAADTLPSARGRRNPAATRARGHYVRAVADETPTDLALDATVRAAARRGPDADGRPTIRREDLHQKQRAGRTGTLVFFVVDASGSMAARRRMEAVKGAVLDLLQDAYEERDQVGVVVFRGPEAAVVLAPTNRVELAEQALRTLPTGGRTPLAHALTLTADVVCRARRAHPELPILLVILSDGKANVSLPGTGADPWQQALQAAEALAEARVPALVLDPEAGIIRSGRAQELAQALQAEYLHLEELSAGTLTLIHQSRGRPLKGMFPTPS